MPAALAAALAHEPDVRLAVLFGSTARQECQAASDVDIGVLGPSSRQLPSLGVRLERAIGRTVDLIDLAQAPPLLRFEIARDGLLLAEREPHLWSDVRARALVDWWDWAPIARRFHSAAAERLRRQVADGSA